MPPTPAAALRECEGSQTTRRHSDDNSKGMRVVRLRTYNWFQCVISLQKQRNQNAWELDFKQYELNTQIRNKFYQLHNKTQDLLAVGWLVGGLMKILAYTSMQRRFYVRHTTTD